MSTTSPTPVPSALGLLETFGFTPAMVALDAMEKGGMIEVIQIELNDMLGVCIKIRGDAAAVESAVAQGFEVAQRMQARPVRHVIHRPDAEAWKAIESPEEYNPLIQQNVVVRLPSTSAVGAMSTPHEAPSALGFLETQGFTAVFEAIDTACKAANVDVVGKENWAAAT